MLSNRRTVTASVIIPSWNGKHLLKICLPSLKKQSFKDFEVVVVDNGSTDGSLEYIKKYFPEVKLVELKSNSGFAHAVNLGIKICVGEYIVLINNDTKVDNCCLEYLIKTAKAHKDAGMVAAKMLNFYNPKLIDSAGDWIDIAGHAGNIGQNEKDDGKFNKEGYCFLVTGGGCLIKREVFEKVGFFDENYFAYMEDVDFCLRAQMQSFKAWFEPKAVIYHMHKATSNKIKPFAEYLQFRNMTQTVIKNFPRQLIFRDLNWLIIILVNLNTVLFFFKQGLLKEALKAEGYIIYHLIRLLKERQHIQSNIKVPLVYILENIRPKKITFFGILKNGI